jgi:hypothetical protein
MSIPAWRVISWAPVHSTVQRWNRIVKEFRPLGSSVFEDEADGLRYGQVLWGVEESDISIGMAWDWREAFPGVVAMSDPMTIVTNVLLVDAAERAIGDSQRIVHLNTGIYQLPWQAHICQVGREGVRKLRTAMEPAANRASAAMAA